MSYAVDKLASHPVALKQLRETGTAPLISVHLMPQNLCNQRCSFCSYRLPDNKNSSHFNEGVHIPWPDMVRLLADFAEMGVQGIEVTGGGEPLAYPQTRELWEQLASLPFATALVTNGTLLKDRAELVTQKMKWARVSIDASNAKTYAEMRKCPAGHFVKAWEAVAQLRKHAPADPDFRLGVGFVLCNENVAEVYDFVRMVKESGADNVRLSVTFSDQNEDFFEDKEAVRRAIGASIAAKQDFEDETFKVHNMMPTRGWEIQHPAQDYKRCPTKDVLCVVEGECKVYTCCTFTGSVHGLYGKFTEHPDGFRGLWDSFREWRRDFRADQYCQCACLYRDRNLAMNELIDGEETPAVEHLHKEFV